MRAVVAATLVIWFAAAMAAGRCGGIGGYDDDVRQRGIEATTGEGPGAEAIRRLGPAAAPISLGLSAGSTTAGRAVGEPAADDFVTTYGPPYGGARLSFGSSILSPEAGEAPVYGNDSGAETSVDGVAALASALGLSGEPRPHDGVWVVGPDDESGPRLTVDDGTWPGFSYVDPLIDPYSCPDEDGIEIPCAPTGDIPTARDAIHALRALVVSTGRDPEDFEFDSVTSDGESAMARSAEARFVVDGRATDRSWHIEFTFDGIVSAWGALAPVDLLGEVEIVSEQEGLERLAEPRFGPERTVIPPRPPHVVHEGPANWMPRTEPPALPRPGTVIDWPVEAVEIVGVRLVLGTETLIDGRTMLVPRYEFTDANGGEWEVIAIAESYLEYLRATE